MANNKSAIKRWHQSLKRRDRNRGRRSVARTAIRSVREALDGGATEAELKTLLAGAYSALDTAAKLGSIHTGNADRRKRRLAAAVAKASS